MEFCPGVGFIGGGGGGGIVLINYYEEWVTV